MISALYKGKDLSSLVSNYRDIMLANCVGKNLSKDIRKTLLPDVRRYVVGTQYGAGLNGGDTSKAHLYHKLVVDMATKYKVSVRLPCICLFGHCVRLRLAGEADCF